MVPRASHDGIILDLMLPGLSGAELLRRFRQQGGTAPVLVLTARDSTNDKVEIFEAGADDYLTKPFAFAELLVRVKSLLRRCPLERPPVLRLADLEVDRLGQQVKRSGKRLELTAKEYSLLEYLLTHAGQVLSRTMIVEHVWGQSFENLTNIVDVYVRHCEPRLTTGFQPSSFILCEGLVIWPVMTKSYERRSLKFQLIVWYAGY
jgi:two-component system copper resistance phosphate regulon response regulator CusR